MLFFTDRILESCSTILGVEFVKHRLDSSRKMDTKQSWVEKKFKTSSALLRSKMRTVQNEMHRQEALVHNKNFLKLSY